MAAYPFRAHPGFWNRIAHACAIAEKGKKRFNQSSSIQRCGRQSGKNGHSIGTREVIRIANDRNVHRQNQGCAQPGGHPWSDLNALAGTTTDGGWLPRTAASAFWVCAVGMGAVRFDFGRRFGTFARESTIHLQKTYRDAAFC